MHSRAVLPIIYYRLSKVCSDAVLLWIRFRRHGNAEAADIIEHLIE
jgi:hypothetical protein